MDMAEKKKGIDISYHQGNINFKSVKASGIEFVILREGYRKSLDTKFLEYVKQCKAVGLPILGVYHFSYALNEKQAKEEGEFCVKNVEKAGLGKDTLIFFDFEYDTVKKAKAAGVTLGASQCKKHTVAFCEAVRAKGYPVGVYTNNDYRKHMYDTATLKPYLLWLADYTGGPDVECLLQQYTSSGKVNGIGGNVDMNYYFPKTSSSIQNGGSKKKYSRNEVVKLAKSWIGKKESDGSHKTIIDLYNTLVPLPRGYKLKYTDSWCAGTWSAIAAKLGYTKVMPVECSCGFLIENAKKMGCWQENDGYVPEPGDAVLYDWDDSGKGDNTGWPDHIGVVEEVFEDSGYFVVIEGNYKDSVKRRTVSINGKFIRGFITPKYTDSTTVNQDPVAKKSVSVIAKEVIAGKWGNGDTRKKKLKEAGYNYDEIQKEVNKIVNTPSKTTTESIKTKKKVTATCKAQKKDTKLAGTYKTTANLYCRNDAGTNKKALCKIPKGTSVMNYGYYNLSGSTKWLYIQVVLNGVTYTGFSSSKYLKRV